MAAAGFALVAGATQGTYDTYRDLWFAAGIVEAQEFPFTGPGINQAFHLGPVWYYVVAAALLFLPAPQAAVVLTALLVAARFPLAYAVGRSIGGRRTALWAVALMAIPGWWLLALGVITHTAATEAAVLWLALATVGAMRSAHWLRHTWLGLAAAVAIHAHPTTVTLAAIAAALALSRTPRRQWSAAAVCLVLPTAAFVAPYLLGGGFSADLGSIGRYAQGLAELPQPLRLLRLPLAMVVGGPFHAVWIWGALERPAAAALAIAPWVLAGIPFASGLRRAGAGGARHVAALFAAAFLLQSLLLVLIRPVTPPWMAFSLTPLMVFSIAPLAAAGFATRARLRNWLLAMVLGAAATGSAVAMVGLTAPARGSPSWWPRYAEGSPGPMSVTEFPIGRQPAGPLLASLREGHALLPIACAPLQIHGQLALLAERSLGYPWRLACGGTDHVRLGGAPLPGAGQHFGVWHPDVLAFCEAGDSDGKLPDPVAMLGSSPPLSLGDPRRYPPRAPVGSPASQRFSLTTSAELLFVGTLLADYAPLRLIGATVDGATAQRVAGTRAFVVLSCGAACSSAGSRNWDIAVAALPGSVDIVGFSCPPE